MATTRQFIRLVGKTPGTGYFAYKDRFSLTGHGIPLQYDLELGALASWRRNTPIGGSQTRGLQGAQGGVFPAAFAAIDSLPFTIDNTNNQLANSANLVCQVVVYCRVDDPSISITPFIQNLTFPGAAVTGVACSATNSAFTGTNSIQTLVLPLHTGVCQYQLWGTVSNLGFQFWMQGWLDLYVNL